MTKNIKINKQFDIRDSLLIGLCNSLTSLYAGVVVFLILGFLAKVEKIYEDSLDLIPSSSPSVKIQIIGGKVYLRQ